MLKFTYKIFCVPAQGPFHFHGMHNSCYLILNLYFKCQMQIKKPTTTREGGCLVEDLFKCWKVTANLYFRKGDAWLLTTFQVHESTQAESFLSFVLRNLMGLQHRSDDKIRPERDIFTFELWVVPDHAYLMCCKMIRLHTPRFLGAP